MEEPITQPICLQWDDLSVGEKLFVWRSRAGLTTFEAAQMVGVTASRYILAERDRLNVRPNLKLWHLRYGEAQKYPEPPPEFKPRVIEANERCVVLRRRSKMTQADLASAIGLSHTTLSYMENGHIDCTPLVEFWASRAP